MAAGAKTKPRRMPRTTIGIEMIKFARRPSFMAPGNLRAVYRADQNGMMLEPSVKIETMRLIFAQAPNAV